MDGRTVGVLGGGPLSRMLVLAGCRLGIRIAILDPDGSNSLAGQLSSLCVEGSCQEPAKIRELASICDVLTVLSDSANVETLQDLENEGFAVRPSCKVLRIVQDRLLQKEAFASSNLPTTEFMAVSAMEDAFEAGSLFSYPFILKTRVHVEGSRRHCVVQSIDQLRSGFDQLGGKNLLAERMVDFAKELTVLVICQKASTECFPVAEVCGEEGRPRLVLAPARMSSSATLAATRLAKSVAAALHSPGLFAVDLFLLSDDSLEVRRVSAGPSLAGQFSLETCAVDQCAAALRLLLDLPCPAPTLRVGAALLAPVYSSSASLADSQRQLASLASLAGVSVHWYGHRKAAAAGRLLGHALATAQSLSELAQHASALAVDSPDSSLRRASARVALLAEDEDAAARLSEAARVLDAFGVSHEVALVSAYLTPTRLFSYAQTAGERGIEVIVAAARAVGPLAGMVAALTSLPVIALPLGGGGGGGEARGPLPTQVPVAAVAADSADMAGLLAVRILAVQSAELRRRLEEYSDRQEEEALRRAAKWEASARGGAGLRSGTS